MRYLFLLVLLVQLAVQVSYTLPLITAASSTIPVKINNSKYADMMLHKRGLISLPKPWKPKTSKVNPAPASEPVLPKPAPVKPLGDGPYRPKVPAPGAQMTIQEKNRLMANAHGVRAGREVVQGARGSLQTLRYGGQQSMYHSKQAMNRFRQGNVGQGIGHLGLAAGKGAKGVVYSPVHFANGLASGARSSATSMGYRYKQYTAPKAFVGGDTKLVRQKAEATRTSTPGYDRSTQYVQNRWTRTPQSQQVPVQPVVPQPAIGAMGLQGRPMMTLDPNHLPSRGKARQPFVPLPVMQEHGVYM